jgi:hypothetical protein
MFRPITQPPAMQFKVSVCYGVSHHRGGLNDRSKDKKERINNFKLHSDLFFWEGYLIADKILEK